MTEFTHIYVFTLIRQLRGETSFGGRKREMAREREEDKERAERRAREREGERETN